jgi:RNA polymerase sigma-70 factor (ECF subfamily)
MDVISRLVREHTGRLLSVARREGLGRDDAVDAVQDALCTFLRLPTAEQGCDDEEHAAVLVVIVRNVARNLRRRHHRARPHTTLDLDNRGDGPADARAGVDDLIAAAEERLALAGCVLRLADLHRQVVTLRVLEELSGDEVAARLGLTAGHVAVLLHRAKHALRACLAAVPP